MGSRKTREKNFSTSRSLTTDNIQLKWEENLDENTSTSQVQNANKIINNVRLIKTIGPRTEQTIFIQTTQKDLCLVRSAKLAENVYLGNSISQPIDGKTALTNVNAPERDYKVRANKVCGKLEILDNYDIIDNPQYELDTNMLKTLEEKLKLDHMTEDERSSI